LGELQYQKFDTHALTSNASLLINVANGNLILQTQEMNIAGTGPSLSISRYFNDLATGSGQLGSHNTLSVGNDVHITANADGSATYQGPSGFQVTFPSNGSGGYTTPAAYTEATLAPVTGGGWTLTFNKSGEIYTFNSSGNQIKDASANGEAINYAYNSNGTLNTATDTQGRVTSFLNYTGTNVGKITDSSGRYTTYTYTNGQLTGSTDPVGGTWQYQYYDTRGNINQITDPRGYTTTLTYDSTNRITSIKYNDFTSTTTTWTYTYNSGNTVVTDPLSHQTTYNYDSTGRVINVLDAVGANHGSSWDPNNNQTATTDPSSYQTTAGYDSFNNLKSVQNPTLANGIPGAKSTLTYGSTAHPYLPVSGTDSAGNLVAYSYNTNGNLISASSTAAGGTGMVTSTKKLQGDPNGSGGTYRVALSQVKYAALLMATAIQQPIRMTQLEMC
jgi:YD repeat-containing protein